MANNASKLDEWMPLYIGRYLGDTMQLTYDQHGPYLLLLMHYWRKGPLPDDDQQLASIARVPIGPWKRMAAVIRGFFTREDDGMLHQKKSDEERARRQEISCKRSNAGKAGAEAKHSQEQQVTHVPAVAIATHLPDVCLPVATPQLQLQVQEEELPPPSGVVVAGATSDDVQRAFDAWNDLATELGLSAAKTLDKGRRSKIGARLRENGGLTAWGEALSAIRASPFLAGDNKEGWRATLDFVCQASSFRKLVEGAYIKSAPSTPQLTLLRPIDGGKGADQADAWGIEAWCVSIGAEPVTNPEHLKRGKWKHSGCIIDSVARNVAEAAGFGRSLRVDWTPLLGWLQAGCSPSENIYPAVTKAAEYFRSKGDPATNLNAFEQSVTRRRAA